MDNHPTEPELTDAQKAEIDRRLAEAEAAPDDGIPWEEVRAHGLGQIQDRVPTSIHQVESTDDFVSDLIEHNQAFRALLERSLASGREPFPFAEPEE
jgi:hypothetical protein